MNVNNLGRIGTEDLEVNYSSLKAVGIQGLHKSTKTHKNMIVNIASEQFSSPYGYQDTLESAMPADISEGSR